MHGCSCDELLKLQGYSNYRWLGYAMRYGRTLPFTTCSNNASFSTPSYLHEAEFSGKALVKNKYSNLLSTENELLLCLKLPTAPKQICDSKQTHLSH